MRICRVLGNIVASVKHPAFAGQRLMIVQQIDERGNDVGSSFIAIDRVQSGPGDRVLVLTEGTGVRQIMQMGDILPIRSAVVGIVDEVDVP
jgi:ethanolamine utilization protein EutN